MSGWLGLAAWVWVLVLLIGLALFALGLVLLRRASGPTEDGGAPDARTILDERLARGEIDATEHARRRAVLDER